MLGLPVLDAMLTVGGRLPSAHAASAKGPRRLIVFFTGNGIVMDQWRPSQVMSPSNFTLTDMMSPLNAYKSELLMVNGLAYRSARDPNNQRAQGHPGGTVAALTGYYAAPGNMYGGGGDRKIGYSRGPSIDYAISKRLGNVTRFPAYYLGAACDSKNAAVNRRCFFTDKQTPIAPVDDPARVYTQLFGELDTTGNNAALEKRIAQRKLVLSEVRSEMAQLRCKLSSDDRARLDQHAEQLASIESRLTLTTTGGGAACAKPKIASSIDTHNENMRQLTSTQNDMIAMAFACDLTRVIGYQMGISDSGGDQSYNFLGFVREMHAVSHLFGDEPMEKLIALGKLQASVIADLVKKLKAVPDVDGGSVMDNTAIVWMSEVGNAWQHSYDDNAMTIIGKGGGYFRTNQYQTVGTKVSHNRMLLHFLHYMGLDDVKAFGAPGSYNDGGPLTGVMA